MKFVHTFWSQPLLKKKFADIEDSIRYTLTDYACSAAWIHRCGYEIVLYTDDFGAKLFDFIPYDEVVILDTDYLNGSTHFAAKFKFEAMKDMELGDVLIDGDLIIRSRQTCQEIEKDTHDALYSFFEPHSYTIQGGMKLGYYREMIDKLSKFNFNEPYHLPSLNDLSWVNTSMLKLTNQALKNNYLEGYDRHLKMLSDTDFGKTWPDIIIEQYFLGCLLECGNFNHTPMFVGFPTEKANNEALSKKFTHLGACKISHNKVVEGWLKEANQKIYRDTLKEIKNNLENKQLFQ